MLAGVFHFEMTFTGGPGSLSSQSVVFPSYRKNTFTPDFLLHPDKYTRPFGRDGQGKTQKMPFHLQLTGFPESEAWVIYSSQ